VGRRRKRGSGRGKPVTDEKLFETSWEIETVTEPRTYEVWEGFGKNARVGRRDLWSYGAV